MFREKYHNMNEQIRPSPQLIDRVMNKANNNRRKSIFHKPIVITAILVICILGSFPVLSATIPAFYHILYEISPSTAQFFKPIQKSDISNGIKMQVEAAYIHENVVEIYIAMQDIEGDRIDETTDLFDSYSINRPFSSSAGCILVDYDDKIKTATFLIEITEFDNKKIIGKKITFSVREFLSGKKHYDGMPIDIDLSIIENDVATQFVDIMGGGGINYERYMSNYKDIDYDYKTKVLLGTKSITHIVEDIELTAIGYIDDMLHIQTATKNKLIKDNHGDIYLKDKDGDIIHSDYTVSFIEDGNSENRIDYSEFIFDIPQSELSHYSLYGNFITSGMLTKGDWEVTFPIKEMIR